MSRARVQVTIDRLRLHGVSRAEAATLTDHMKSALAAHLEGNASALRSGEARHLSVALPPGSPFGAAHVGQAAGQQIAHALGKTKGGA